MFSAQPLLPPPVFNITSCVGNRGQHPAPLFEPKALIIRRYSVDRNALREQCVLAIISMMSLMIFMDIQNRANMLDTFILKFPVDTFQAKVKRENFIGRRKDCLGMINTYIGPTLARVYKNLIARFCPFFLWTQHIFCPF